MSCGLVWRLVGWRRECGFFSGGTWLGVCLKGNRKFEGTEALVEASAEVRCGSCGAVVQSRAAVWVYLHVITRSHIIKSETGWHVTKPLA